VISAVSGGSLSKTRSHGERRRRRSTFLFGLGLAIGLAWCLPLVAANADERDALRVCADPNSLPFSNEARQGFENRIAELLAEDLGLPLEYVWFPQRRGFVRQTLRARRDGGGYKCDLIMGVPAGFEMGVTTRPYYRSTYALVIRSDGDLAAVETAEDFVALDPAIRDRLKVGAHSPGPGTLWLTRNGMRNQIVAFPALDADPDSYPGQLIDQELAERRLDAAIVWGPVAGYFAKLETERGASLKVIPLASEAGIRFDFAIASAARFGDGEWRDRVQEFYDRRQVAVEGVLTEFGVPLLENKPVQKNEDDD
jgi:quinoprotein dehydrogenase-associated probable ABC transporter substrate-binding protein